MVSRFPGWSNRAYAAALVCALVAASCGGDAPTGNALGPPARFDLVSGDNQTAPVGTELPAPLVVKVLDASGRPIPSQVVNFVVTLGGGRAFAGAASTTTAGIAQERWTLGTVAGAQTIEVRSVDGATGQPRTWAVFSATATAGPAQSVVAVGGNDQSGVAGQPLADSLAVKVIDQYGNGVANVPVAWSAKSGSGSVSPATSTSNGAGVAKARWTLAPTAGMDSAAATAAGIPTAASFQATGATGSPSVVAVVAGDNQTALVTSVLPTRLAARVTDANGNPVSGVPVTWTVSGSGGSLSSATAVTDANGLASATWTLGQLAGPLSLSHILRVRWLFTGPWALRSGDRHSGWSPSTDPPPSPQPRPRRRSALPPSAPVPDCAARPDSASSCQSFPPPAPPLPGADRGTRCPC